ncbi:hypothetical protein [Streptomyces sp. NPDC006971]|uniref:hypothetical protein n=1 Tax=Streptomyces sp. NPDC006971 TaxID=3154784 RepID=UPI0033FC37B8
MDDDASRDTAVRQAFRDAVARGDLDAVPVRAGEGLDLVTAVEPAADLVADLVSGPSAPSPRHARACPPNS